MSQPGLSVEQVQDIARLIAYRTEKFVNEPLDVSIAVVLLNYGDQYTPVDCIKGEWSGIKAELEWSSANAIPHCPNGHVLTERAAGRKRLALVDYEL